MPARAQSLNHNHARPNNKIPRNKEARMARYVAVRPICPTLYAHRDKGGYNEKRMTYQGNFESLIFIDLDFIREHVGPSGLGP